MKTILFLSMFILFSSMAENPEHDYLLRCDQSCVDSGDVRGVVIDSQCGCWNPNDISKSNVKVQTGQGSYIKDKKTFSWSFE